MIVTDVRRDSCSLDSSTNSYAHYWEINLNVLKSTYHIRHTRTHTNKTCNAVMLNCIHAHVFVFCHHLITCSSFQRNRGTETSPCVIVLPPQMSWQREQEDVSVCMWKNVSYYNVMLALTSVSPTVRDSGGETVTQWRTAEKHQQIIQSGQTGDNNNQHWQEIKMCMFFWTLMAGFTYWDFF